MKKQETELEIDQDFIKELRLADKWDKNHK